MKVCLPVFISLASNASRLTVNLNPELTVCERLSSETRKYLLRLSTSREIMLLSGTTTGLMLRLCGLTGVMTKLLDIGLMIGPPQLNEYPVEPVGVEMISPSAQ